MNNELLEQAVALAARGYQVGVQQEDDENGNLVWVAFVPRDAFLLRAAGYS